MANYDLYTELQLDKDMPPYEIAEILGERAADLRNRGYGADSPEIDQVETARLILGDPYKRDIYEAALYGPEDDVVNIRWLHDLADSQSPTAAPAAATGTPSYKYSASYEPLQDSSVAESAGPSADVTRAHSIDGGPGSVPDTEATRVTPVVPEQTPGEAATPGQDADDTSDRPAGDLSAGAPGEMTSGPAAPANSWQQQGPAGGFAGVPHPPKSQRPSPQLDVTTWGVGDRTRSESKVYLSILAVIAVGMIYPLIVLLTAGPNDLNAGLAVMKATLFTLAHVAFWTSINEIVWGVRKIVAPDRTTEK
jgi:hypothetical protein